MKRWLVRICVFLLLGAIVNIAVAWLLAGTYVFRSDPVMNWGVSSKSGLAWFYAMGHSPGYAVVQREVVEMNEQELAYLVGFFDRFSKVPAPTWSLASTTNPLSMPEDNDPLVEQAAGWPLLAMKCDYVIEVPGYVDGVANGIAISGIRGDANSLRLLPLRPIWPGFAINTVFYAGVLWLLFAVPFALRRRWRIRRGLCPACAYPVGTNTVCTECGTSVSTRSTRLE
jgi:hypothetical protein